MNRALSIEPKPDGDAVQLRLHARGNLREKDAAHRDACAR
jgi:hypothetical protein